MTHLEQTASPGTERGGHTPGPWWVAGKGTIRWGDPKSHITGWIGTLNWRNKEANARLIAAAPTMLEALQKLANEVGWLQAFESELRAELGNTYWSDLMLRLREADAAIALAEGRTPTETKGGASE